MLIEERQHPVVQQISSGDRCLSVVEFDTGISSIARSPYHRSPDEALHDVPTDRWTSSISREGINQHGVAASASEIGAIGPSIAACSSATQSRPARLCVRR